MRRKRKKKGGKRHSRYLDVAAWCSGSKTVFMSFCEAHFCFSPSGKGDGKAEDPVPAGEAARSWGCRNGAADDQRQQR